MRGRTATPFAKYRPALPRAARHALIGFGTHVGTVAAASDWGGEMEVKRVRLSHRDSYERLCHDASVARFLLDLGTDGVLRRRLLEPRLERFIGVIYRPDTELLSHYSDASLPQQFDAFVWFEETSAVKPRARERKAGRSRHLPVRAVRRLYN
jgi:erythromycin esterase-like protein